MLLMVWRRVGNGVMVTVKPRTPRTAAPPPDGDIEMIEDMLARQRRRWQAAVAAWARIEQAREAEPRSAVPAVEEWLAHFQERARENQLHLRSAERESSRTVDSFGRWQQLVSNQRPLSCKDCHHHSPAPVEPPSTQVSASRGEHRRAGKRTAELNALPSTLPPWAAAGQDTLASTSDASPLPRRIGPAALASLAGANTAGSAARADGERITTEISPCKPGASFPDTKAGRRMRCNAAAALGQRPD